MKKFNLRFLFVMALFLFFTACQEVEESELSSNSQAVSAVSNSQLEADERDEGCDGQSADDITKALEQRSMSSQEQPFSLEAGGDGGCSLGEDSFNF